MIKISKKRILYERRGVEMIARTSLPFIRTDNEGRYVTTGYFNGKKFVPNKSTVDLSWRYLIKHPIKASISLWRNYKRP